MPLFDYIQRAESRKFTVKNSSDSPEIKYVDGIEVMLNREPSHDMLEQIANDFIQYLPSAGVRGQIVSKDKLINTDHPFKSYSIFIGDTEVYRVMPVFGSNQVAIHQIPRTHYSKHILERYAKRLNLAR